jgi:DNA-binding NarL/FixJ family response regulator
MELWKRLLARLRLPPGSYPRRFELDEPLHTALAERAGRDQRPLDQVGAELLIEGLEHLQSSDGLKQRWEKLSQREQEVTALTCLGYTNRQMAAYLRLSPSTVKGYVSHALSKWNAHGKEELRLMLEYWDFEDWAPKAP